MRPFRLLLLLASLSPFIQVNAQEGNELDSVALMNAMLKMFSGDGVTVKPLYTFQHQVTYQSEEHKWDGEKKQVFDLYFNNGSTEIAMGMDMREQQVKGRVLMVFDLATNRMANFMTTDTMKVCIRMQIPDFGGGDEKDKAPAFKATGKKRTIAGREAHEWMNKDDGEETRLWIMESGGADLSAAFHAFGKVNGKPTIHHGDFGTGLVLAGSVKRKDENKPFYIFEATEVKLDSAFTFNTEGYAVQ